MMYSIFIIILKANRTTKISLHRWLINVSCQCTVQTYNTTHKAEKNTESIRPTEKYRKENISITSESK